MTALARRPEVIAARHDRLRGQQGDALESGSVRAATRGRQDAMLSAFGPSAARGRERPHRARALCARSRQRSESNGARAATSSSVTRGWRTSRWPGSPAGGRADRPPADSAAGGRQRHSPRPAGSHRIEHFQVDSGELAKAKHGGLLDLRVARRWPASRIVEVRTMRGAAARNVDPGGRGQRNVAEVDAAGEASCRALHDLREHGHGGCAVDLGEALAGVVAQDEQIGRALLRPVVTEVDFGVRVSGASRSARAGAGARPRSARRTTTGRGRRRAGPSLPAAAARERLPRPAR